VLPAQVDLERYEVASTHPALGAAGAPVISVGRAAVDALGEARHPADIALALATGQAELSPPLPWQGLQEAATEALGADIRFFAAPREARRSLEAGARAGFLAAAGAAPAPGAAPAIVEPFAEPAGERVAAAAQEEHEATTAPASLRLVPFESVKSGDGRGANRPWLQELPDPLASVMWASWVELSSHDAAALGVRTGDWVRLRAAGQPAQGAELEAGVVVSPATRPGTVGAPLGHGHRDGGRFARGRGVNVAQLAGDERVVGTAAPALGEIRVVVERVERAPQRLAVYGRGLGAPEHLPRGWGAHDPAQRGRVRGGDVPGEPAAAEPAAAAEGGSQ
jgi:anaerobic selenocysteine-containing dehydrogenase